MKFSSFCVLFFNILLKDLTTAHDFTVKFADDIDLKNYYDYYDLSDDFTNDDIINNKIQITHLKDVHKGKSSLCNRLIGLQNGCIRFNKHKPMHGQKVIGQRLRSGPPRWPFFKDNQGFAQDYLDIGDWGRKADMGYDFVDNDSGAVTKIKCYKMNGFDDKTVTFCLQ